MAVFVFHLKGKIFSFRTVDLQHKVLIFFMPPYPVSMACLLFYQEKKSESGSLSYV